MSDNEKNVFNEGGLDLGSSEFDGFTEFEADEDISKIFNIGDDTSEKPEDTKKDEGVSYDETVTAEVIPRETVAEGTETEVKHNEEVAESDDKSSVSKENGNAEEKSEVPDIFAEAISTAETMQAESIKNSLVNKLPVFVYGGAKEDVVDTSKTFDALRVEKAEDFPELDDETSVSWKMNYGTISKSVTTPKKTTIASMKKQIEGSKEFSTMLKKAKGNIVCEIKPSVVAKKKGIQSSYKGVFLSIGEAQKSDKVISFIPSSDGRVYEMRKNKIGTFITQSDNVTILDKVRAGFTPALPKIPYKILSEIVSFFRAQISYKNEFEALAYVYWSVENERYYVHVPEQHVTKTRVKAVVPDLDEEKFILVMEIHSHNTMSAMFSNIDDADEKATRLYSVVGSLDKLYPDILVRFCVGGKFENIDASMVFEYAPDEYPFGWNSSLIKGAKA